MFKYREDIDSNILNIIELDKLGKALANYTTNPKDIKNNEALFEATNTFFSWYISYANSIIKKKVLSPKSICDCIFQETFDNERQRKSYLFACIVISKEYVEYLQPKITLNNISGYKHAITELEIDLENLIAYFEVQYKKSIDEIHPKTWRRKNLSPTDIFSAVRTLFFIEEYEKIEELYLRDLKPVTMFQIRQILEVFGKNVIGYHSINDSKGNAIKKFTQVAWEFIRKEVSKENPKITFPFDVEMIIAINKWSNVFVHTTYIFESYIQFFALKTIGLLFQSKTKGIKIYTGEWSNKFDIADIKITNYNLLKNDFETFLNSKQKGSVVEWIDIKKVGAYIINL